MAHVINWLVANAATIAVSAVLLVLVGLIIFKMVKDKREGKSGCSCGCGCNGCALADKCNSTKTHNK